MDDQTKKHFNIVFKEMANSFILMCREETDEMIRS